MQMHPSKFSVRLHRRDGNWIYRKKVKNVLLVLQAFLAAVLAWSFFDVRILDGGFLQPERAVEKL